MVKKTLSVAIAVALLGTGSAIAGGKTAQVQVVDKTFDVAGGMLAYTEFELSGEPMVEALGLDLDVLDPNLLDQPTAFDYSAGIESYEYSEEAMYALNYQSRMGPHLANGPLNAARGGKPQQLGERFIELAKSVGFPAEEIPLNIYPITIPYAAGVPEFAQKVDMTMVNGDEIELFSHGDSGAKTVRTEVPAYYRDYKTLNWKEDGMDKHFTPAAAGAAMLKDVMWAQDFLGGMHTLAEDEEVEAASSTMDQDGKHALGVSTADGMNGMILTEITWDRLLMLRDRLGYDGKNLGARINPQYDATKHPIWFPHSVAVTEEIKNGLKSAGALKVSDSASTLRDTWLLLWPMSEFYALSDQRTQNSGQNPGFLAAFDGAPFAAAPKANTDADTTNDTRADDPFSAASTLVNLLFQNLDTLHFNTKAGTFVDSYDGKQGKQVSTYDAAYSLAALAIFQRARDALPVGYGSAEAGAGLSTAQGARALELIRKQADFIITKLISKDGLVHAGYTLGKGPSNGYDVSAQFATIRGLTAAFVATKNIHYKEAARKVFLAAEKHFFDTRTGTYSANEAAEHTPYTAAAISSGLRSLLLSLKNEEGEKTPELELAHLAKRYTTWFHTVINGGSVKEGMQLAEWLGDSGENVIKDSTDIDTDKDNVPQITGAGGQHGTAQTMAARVRILP